jgi:hypothetical protein
MRFVTLMAMTVAIATAVAGAQSVTEPTGGPGKKAASVLDGRSPLPTSFSRTGLHKLLPPGEGTFDTLWFLPPAGPPDPANPVLARIIRNIAIEIDSVDFPEDSALTISIVHAGYNDTLVQGLSRGGADFLTTVFADSAAVSIADGIPPFTGEFAPSRPLSPYVGRDATGSYILQILNHSPDRSGTLQGWGIALEIATVFTSAAPGSGEIPGSLRLFQNFPNPFNPQTTIRFALPRRSRVTLTLFTPLGQQIAVLFDGEEEAGYHQLRLDGTSLATGIYFYRLQAGRYVETKKLLILH